MWREESIPCGHHRRERSGFPGVPGTNSWQVQRWIIQPNYHEKHRKDRYALVFLTQCNFINCIIHIIKLSPWFILHFYHLFLMTKSLQEKANMHVILVFHRQSLSPNYSFLIIIPLHIPFTLPCLIISCCLKRCLQDFFCEQLSFKDQMAVKSHGSWQQTSDCNWSPLVLVVFLSRVQRVVLCLWS